MRLGLVGPLPPPNGGMAMQTLQLARLLAQEGVEVEQVQTNAPYRPVVVSRIRGLRALFRLLPYLWRIWRLAGRVDAIHLMANSGWSWQLFAAPVIWLGWLRKTPVIVNYRGGEAREYLATSARWVKPSMARAARLVVPSGFLRQVFGEVNLASTVIPNIIDLETFYPVPGPPPDARFTLVITRNLEPIYGLDTAIRAVALVREEVPDIQLKIAGSGPQRDELEQLVKRLGLDNVVLFLDRLERREVVDLYHNAHAMLNPTRVDNMPNSVLEALACGLPVISTNVGGVPYIVEDGQTALLVSPDEPRDLAKAVIRLCRDSDLRSHLSEQGRRAVAQYTLGRGMAPVARRLQQRGGGRMSLYTRFVSRVLFPLHERLKGHSTVAAFRSLEQSQWLPVEQLQQLQLRRLRDFLVRIGKDVPYYRELFASLAFEPGGVDSLADIQRLPLTGKADIRANMDQLKAENSGPLEKFSTGGSTGEPLIFFRGKERVSHDVAAKWRATRWWDVDIGDPEIVVWGSPIELGSQDRVRLLRDKILRTELLSAFEMSNANLLQFTQRLKQFRPRMLFGYPSSLALMAEYVTNNGYKVDDLGIKVVFVTSERLYEHQREAIETAFGAPVANGYGGRDAGFIAHQCPQGGMHVTVEDILVEIVGEQGEVLPHGEKGEIVVTHMSTGDFPFVRYRTGDIGCLSEGSCPCGRGLPLLAEIEGRSTDFVRAADGTVLHGLALIYVLREIPEVGEFKIVQESVTSITVQLVTSAADTRQLEKTVTEQFRRRLGDSLVVNFEYVSKIEREASGKFRYVVSQITG